MNIRNKMHNETRTANMQLMFRVRDYSFKFEEEACLRNFRNEHPNTQTFRRFIFDKIKHFCMVTGNFDQSLHLINQRLQL